MIAQGTGGPARRPTPAPTSSSSSAFRPPARTTTTSGVDWFRMEGGKQAENWGGPDMLSFLQQLGVMPGPGTPAGPKQDYSEQAIACMIEHQTIRSSVSLDR